MLSAELRAELGPGRPVPHHGGDEGGGRVDGPERGGGRGGPRGDPRGSVLGQVESHEVFVAADDPEEIHLELPQQWGHLRIHGGDICGDVLHVGSD